MRGLANVRWIVLISVLGCWTGIGTECLPSVGEARLVGEDAFPGGLTGMFLERDWNFLGWVDGSSIRLGDPRSGAELGRITLPPGLRFAGFPVGSGGGLLAAAVTDGTVRVWDAKTGREVASFPAPLGGGCAALSADGTLLAAAGPDGDLRVWEIASGELRFSLAEFLPAGPVCPTAFSSDNRWLAAWAWTGSSQVTLVWDLTAGKLARIFPGQAKLLPSGQVALLIREGALTRIEVWEDPVGRRLSTSRLPIGWEVSAVAYHPEVWMFAVALADGSIRLWDARAGGEVGALPGCIHIDPGTGERARGLLLAFSPDGEEVLLGVLFLDAMRGRTYLWTLGRGRVRARGGRVEGGAAPRGAQRGARWERTVYPCSRARSSIAPRTAP